MIILLSILRIWQNSAQSDKRKVSGKGKLEIAKMEKRFVIHEHYASHHHFDFRLEMEGVLKSWAIPKHPPTDPTEKRLAIHVEDHPLDYIDFEGDIPSGEYGAGRVLIWDRGTFKLIEKGADLISFTLEGMKLKGNFTLVRLKRGKKGNEWLLLKQK
jgi:bifunctional non-homologous end joining protein LigD